MKILLTVALSVLTSCALMAQPINQATPEFKLKMAGIKAQENDYYNALTLLEEYYEDNKDNIEVAYRIGKLEYKLRDYDDASRTFRSLIRRVDRAKERAKRKRKSSSSMDLPPMPDLRLLYARSLKYNGEYDDAIEQYETYINEEAEDPAMVRNARRELEGARVSMTIEMPEDITVSVMDNVNCKSGDESPAIHPEGREFLYASLNTDDVIILDDKQEEDDTEPYMMIYSSKKQGENEWGDGTALDGIINRGGYHTANPSFSKDGNLLFFTRALLQGEELIESTIFYSKRTEDGWGPAQEVRGIGDGYMATHPAAGELYGNEVLFFTANIDGAGQGGNDIYYATLVSEGSYKSPVNLGKAINTPGDEVTPFYNDGILYFSSDGYMTMGGMDIFSAEWNGSEWSKPKNMGKGVNSSVDDRFFTTDEDGYNGYFTSNRADGGRSIRGRTCCDDIWQYNKKKIDAAAKVTAFDSYSKEPIKSISARLIDNTIGFRSRKPVAKQSKEGNDIDFTLEVDKTYTVIVYSDGYLPDTTTITTVGLKDSKLFKVDMTLQPDGPVYDTVTVEINEAIRLNRIYYDFDDDKILKEAEKDLSYLIELLKEYPTMVIELSSHTDSRGNDAYNESLSQRRANSAKKWLTERGIDEKRVVAKGYGETQILNKCKNGVSCDEQEHRYNRRTEFKIIDGPTSIKVRKERVIEKGVENETTEKGDKDTGKAETIAPPKVDNTPKPKVNFRSKKYELGKVRKGQSPSFTYYFVNAGNVPVELDIVSGCECSDIDWPEGKVFQPKEKGEIKVTYKSAKEKDGMGKLEKTIDVFFKQEDPATGMQMMTQLEFIVILEE